MFSQVYRWHSWGKEILLICPRWPSYVRGWTRIRTQRLSQRWLNVYHICIQFSTLGATRCWRWQQCVLCGICVPCGLVKLWPAAATLGKGLLGYFTVSVHGGEQHSWSPFHLLFLSFQTLPGTVLPTRILHISGICIFAEVIRKNDHI